MGDDGSWEANYLDSHYGGAPDECTYHFVRGIAVKLNDDGHCPKCIAHEES